MRLGTVAIAGERNVFVTKSVTLRVTLRRARVAQAWRTTRIRALTRGARVARSVQGS